MLHGKSGYFADSIGIGASAPSGGLHISGGDIRIEGGDAYFENRPFVSGVPIMVQGDLFDVDTTSFYPKSNPSGFITGYNTGLFYASSNPSGFITGVDTSNFYTKDNPSGFITGVDTSNFYTKDNPSGFITGVDTSNFYTKNNPSGFIASNSASVSGASSLSNVVRITQAGYNAISSPLTGTLYIIVG